MIFKAWCFFCRIKEGSKCGLNESLYGKNLKFDNSQYSAHLMASYRAGSLWKEIYIFETEENIGQDKQRDSNYSGEKCTPTGQTKWQQLLWTKKVYMDRTNKEKTAITNFIYWMYLPILF